MLKMYDLHLLVVNVIIFKHYYAYLRRATYVVRRSPVFYEIQTNDYYIYRCKFVEGMLT